MSSLKSLLRVIGSLPALGVVLFVFSVTFPPLEDQTTVSLGIHMIEHVLIVVSGVLIGYPLYRRGYFARIRGRASAWVSLVAVCIAFVLWHLPFFWDAAVLDPLAHAAEHFSFLAAGILLGSLVLALSDRVKVSVLVVGFLAHMVYALILISNIPVYGLYSLAQQDQLALVVFAMDPIFIVLIFYVLWNPPPSEAVRTRYEPPSFGFRSSPLYRRAGLVVPVLTVLVLATLVGFFGWGITQVTTSPQPASGGVTVYILETPVTWNYSPRNITVVIGVNNTVTWVSHSIAYDTITSLDGNFSSGPIAPGGTYKHTFTQAGTFEYHCIYHLWMTGYVRVVAPG